MRISALSPARHIRIALVCFGVGVACLPGVRCAHAQVLAQKNWAGSGVSVELWWKRAVFYRIDPTKFQDLTGSGKGDLAGIAERLDYLQALGVDAVIVETAPAGGKATLLPTAEVSMAFDALVREAVGRHVRVLVDLGAPASQQADAQYVQMARAWLNQGAAGIFVPTPALEKIDGGTHIALLLQQLRALTNSFPGERVMLADAAAQQQDAMLENGLAKYAQLTASAPLGAVGGGGTVPTVAALRQEWMAALGNTSENAEPAAAASTSESATAANPARGRHSQRHETMSRSQMANNPMLVAVRAPAIANPAQRLAMERGLAVMLLASRSAVLLDYGQELGLQMAGTNRPLMQWTPTNVTRRPAQPTDAQAAAASAGYQKFQPYVRPLPKNLFSAPAMPVVEEADLPTPEKIAAMPGFTAGNLDAAMVAPNGATASVVTETYEPRSLLNLYKQLIRLHHGNATVRSGAQTVLNRDDVGALVWVRHAPANSRTSTTVVVACNLSDRPVVLTDLGGVPLRSVRSLLQPAPGDLMKVEPGAVMVGETR
jgi:hypothetical protein